MSTLPRVLLWTTVVPPSLSLGYAIGTLAFNNVWHEGLAVPWGGWTWRFLLTVASAAVASVLVQDTSNDKVWITYVAVTLPVLSAVSVYALRNTRVRMVLGGTAPSYTEVQKKNRNKVYVITGANQGIGKETARTLLQEATTNSTIVLACRSVSKAQMAADELMRHPNVTSLRNKALVVQLDLSDLESIRSTASKLEKDFPVIDCLINNAGLMMSKQQFVGKHQELMFQSNHLGHYLFTRLLLPQIQKSKDPRIINLTSATYNIAVGQAARDKNKKIHRILPTNDLQCTNRKYTMFGQYAVTKLCNIYFTAGLKQRYPDIFCAAVHPGIVRTNVTRNMPWYLRWPNTWFAAVMATLQKNPAQGAWSSLHVAAQEKETLEAAIDEQTSNEIQPLYWVNRQPQPLAQPLLDEWKGLMQQEVDALWDLSAKEVDLPVGPPADRKKSE